TGIKRKAVSNDIVERVIQSMIKLNKAACELMLKHGANAATDITGFGLLGHAYEMASASKVSILLFPNKIPVIDGTKELAAQGILTGGADGNREFLLGNVTFPHSFEKSLEHILYDPQTSGGLLIAIPGKKADDFSKALEKNRLYHEVVGEVVPQTDVAISIR
ncbi:MAG: AIR synthase-related protein, partial [Candidatus Zixiibacteriota bacterium]